MSNFAFVAGRDCPRICHWKQACEFPSHRVGYDIHHHPQAEMNFFHPQPSHLISILLCIIVKGWRRLQFVFDPKFWCHPAFGSTCSLSRTYRSWNVICSLKGHQFLHDKVALIWQTMQLSKARCCAWQDTRYSEEPHSPIVREVPLTIHLLLKHVETIVQEHLTCGRCIWNLWLLDNSHIASVPWTHK